MKAIHMYYKARYDSEKEAGIDGDAMVNGKNIENHFDDTHSSVLYRDVYRCI